MKKVLLIICIFVLGNLNIAKAVSVNWDALGLDVEVTYPDKVTYGDPFGISFFIDSSDLDTYDMMAFIPNIWISNTVDFSNVTWREVITSEDPNYNYDYSGNLGDIHSQYTTVNGGYNIRLLDPYTLPYSSGYTWLERSFSDQVTWSLNNFIIQDNTFFNIELDSDVWLGSSFQTNFVVFDPPANVPLNNAVPEPAALYLLSSLACGIFCFKKKIAR